MAPIVSAAAGPAHAVGMARAALEAVAGAPDGPITPAIETKVQNAVYALRCGDTEPEVLARFEGFAAALRLLSQAKREGRTNLYASRLLRLRKALAA